MNLYEKALALIEAEQVKQAHAALSQPSERDGFEYGRMCGIYSGLGHAHNLLLGLIAEEKEYDDNL